MKKINQESSCSDCAWFDDAGLCFLNPPVFTSGDPTNECSWSHPVVSIHQICSNWKDGSEVWS
jgi:hypothetical protein